MKYPFSVLVVVLCGLSSVAFGDITNGLVIYYPLDGNTADGSGASNDATPHGGPVYTGGVRDTAIVLDGSDDYLSLPAFGTPSDITLNVWAADDNSNTALTNYFSILMRGSIAANAYDLYMGEGWGHMHIRANGSPSSINAYSVDVTENEWHMYTYVVDNTATGTTCRIYRDAIAVGATNITTTVSTSHTTWYVGRRWLNAGATTHWKGALDELRIYDRALSPVDITELHGFDLTPRGSLFKLR